MTAVARKLEPATAADLLALDEDIAAEVVDGVLVEKAAPSFAHGDAQSAITTTLRRPFHRRGGDDPPGGWWIATEVEVEFDNHQVYRPDVVGWRRDRVPERPTERPVRDRPDWVCEVLSPSTARRDQVTKAATLHACGVPHYWLVDPERQALTVLRWQAEGWLVVLSAGPTGKVRAEPFEVVEMDIAPFFGLEPEDERAPATTQS